MYTQARSEGTLRKPWSHQTSAAAIVEEDGGENSAAVKAELGAWSGCDMAQGGCSHSGALGPSESPFELSVPESEIGFNSHSEPSRIIPDLTHNLI